MKRFNSPMTKKLEPKILSPLPLGLNVLPGTVEPSQSTNEKPEAHIQSTNEEHKQATIEKSEKHNQPTNDETEEEQKQNETMPKGWKKIGIQHNQTVMITIFLTTIT